VFHTRIEGAGFRQHGDSLNRAINSLCYGEIIKAHEFLLHEVTFSILHSQSAGGVAVTLIRPLD